MIRRGTVWWVDLGEPQGSAPALLRPVVVVSADNFNRSAIATVVVAVITSTVRLGAAPGNVLLAEGEAGLAKPSVVNVSQLATVDKRSLLEEVGTLTDDRMDLVAKGIRQVLTL